MKVIIAPEVDMLLVSQNSRKQRQSLMNFAPRIGLSTVDYGRLQEIDSFYLDCQEFRDYYRDPYCKLQRPFVFKKHYGKCNKHLHDKCTEQLMLPVSWVREKQPIIYNVNYRRNLVLDKGIDLGGQHYSAPCNIYKR